ncbi:MAG: SH3 domain-containing protein [Aureispira sp.]
MKYIVNCLCLIIVTIGTTQAQSEFDVLLETQEQYQVIYANDPRPVNRRKLYRAEEKLMTYLKEEGYKLDVKLQTAALLPIYGQRYPNMGAVIDSLENEQQIQVFGKDKYGYYKVRTNGRLGYVYNLDRYLTHFDRYPLELVDKYTKIEAKVDAILSRRLNHSQVVYSSTSCNAINHNGQRCGIMNRTATGRCHLH